MEEAAYTGIVLRGERRGTQLGYPTANIPIGDPSVSGIFAAQVKVENKEQIYNAAAFADPSRWVLEAHLLDFKGDLYDKEIEITLLEKIRESEGFSSDETLRERIEDDIEKIRAYFSKK